MSDIAEFLLARIAEDEADARAALDWSSEWFTADDGVLRPSGFVGDGPDVHIVRWHPARVLAECEAKRRIQARLTALAEHLANSGQTMPDWPSGLLIDGISAELALPYADHPDYDPEWSPYRIKTSAPHGSGW